MQAGHSPASLHLHGFSEAAGCSKCILPAPAGCKQHPRLPLSLFALSQPGMLPGRAATQSDASTLEISLDQGVSSQCFWGGTSLSLVAKS